MANVDLKTNFKNGDKLYDYELNNNFKAIQAALGAMNKIVWQNDDNASLVMFAGTTEQITNRELIEGQLLYNTQTGETYIDAMVDTELKRISTGGGTSIQIGGIEPTNPATKLWVEDDMLDNIGTEIESYTKDNIQVLKFDDGTMIMYFHTTVTISDTSPRQQGGLTYYSGYNEITLPEEFYYASFALLTTVLQANMNYYNKSYGAINNAKSIRVSFTSTDANESRPIAVVCIGRWKA